jgi:hypothetical protein
MSSPPPAPIPVGPGHGPGPVRPAIVAGTFYPAHCQLIEKLKKHQLVGSTPTENSKAYWFAYLWEECGGTSFLDPVRNDVVTLFNHIFVLPAKWDTTLGAAKIAMSGAGRLSLRAPAKWEDVLLGNDEVLTFRARDSWDTAPDLPLLHVLEQLLKTGFVRVPAATGTQSPDSSLDVYRSVLTSQLSGRKYILGWRGDSRSVDQLRTAGGFFNKAESEGYAQKVNLRQTWNPFSQPQNRSDYFYRKRKSDNCLATIVSISTDFKTATTFPLLNEDYIRPMPQPPLPTPDEAKRIDDMTLKRHLHVISSNPIVPPQIRIADRQQLYLVIVEGNYFDTRKAQVRASGGSSSVQGGPEEGGFPEIAVKTVPETGILACASYVRVHHGLDEHGGITVLYDASRSLPPTLDGCRRYCQSQSAARELFTAAQTEFNNAVRAMPFHVKWAEAGAVPVPAMQASGGGQFLILGVKNLSGQKLWP